MISHFGDVRIDRATQLGDLTGEIVKMAPAPSPLPFQFEEARGHDLGLWIPVQ